jgi:hypothetical protein
MPSHLAVPPPWKLVSPARVIHPVLNEAALGELAGSDKSLNQDLRKLVGLRVVKNTAVTLPRHKQHWQLLDRVVWLKHVETDELLPIIGGDGAFYVANFCGPSHREETRFFDGSRLNSFINNGYIHSTTRSEEFAQKGCPHRWRRCELGFVPSNPERHGLLDAMASSTQTACGSSSHSGSTLSHKVCIG